jgi:hypothetical protein
MKKSLIIFGLTIASFALSAQSVNANFEVDEQGWTPHFTGFPMGCEEDYELLIKWSKLTPPLNERGGISFFGKNYSDELFLYIQKEITGLLPNTNYRVMFNMNWLHRLDPLASPITVKVGATNREPTFSEEDFLVKASFKRGEIGDDGRDFMVAGQLIPNEFGLPFQQNLQNLDKAFLVNTDDSGRLFLMIGVEPENRKNIDHIFLNTLRIVLAENGGARDISNICPSGVVFFPSLTDDFIFFESNYNHKIETLNIYTQDNYLVKTYTYYDRFDERVFLTTDLIAGTYRFEFILTDGRIIYKPYTVEGIEEAPEEYID